ncbi:MAG: hypothetical protein GY928_03475 [Colwellia sp.]|nr:hypothetical protein [Colwellia sp.]
MVKFKYCVFSLTLLGILFFPVSVELIPPVMEGALHSLIIFKVLYTGASLNAVAIIPLITVESVKDVVTILAGLVTIIAFAKRPKRKKNKGNECKGKHACAYCPQDRWPPGGR